MFLNIFEDRYLQMLKDVRKKSNVFGVVLIKSGIEAHGNLAQPEEVGCLARIATIEEVTKTRFTLLIVGESRFKIDTIFKKKSYLEAEVNLLNYPPGDKDKLQECAKVLFPLLERYIKHFKIKQNVNKSMLYHPMGILFMAVTLSDLPLKKKNFYLVYDDLEIMFKKITTWYQKNIKNFAYAKSQFEQMGNQKPELN